MSSITIKRHNHRVHPCDRSQKLALLKHLIALHSDKEIVVIASPDIAALEQKIDADNVSFKSDKELIENTKFKCDMIISLDLSDSPENYVKRLGQAKSYALLLADDKEQQELYKIETLLKRTLAKEVITDFEPASYLKDRKAAKDLKARQAENIKNQEERDEKRAKAQAKERKESKYLGKDENGKPIFSGKTRERNHRYDGTPRSEEEKRASGRAKPHKSGDKRPWDKENSRNENRGERKPWDKTKGEKKPWDKNSDAKKPWDKEKSSNGRKPYAKKPWEGNASSTGDKRSDERGRESVKPAPKRTGRTIRIPVSKSSKES
ncbi:hypothetical protein [Sulfurimonas sp. HSL3-7]|uniref:hypothetical protein n=1 Tax=Sulfonitrofixus jiaomeiensis TaxID=3131938 RepID=UPI0031F943A4